MRLLRPIPRPAQTLRMRMPTMHLSNSSAQSTLNPSRQDVSTKQRGKQHPRQRKVRRHRFQVRKWEGARVRGRGCTSCSRKRWRRRRDETNEVIFRDQYGCTDGGNMWYLDIICVQSKKETKRYAKRHDSFLPSPPIVYHGICPPTSDLIDMEYARSETPFSLLLLASFAM